MKFVIILLLCFILPSFQQNAPECKLRVTRRKIEAIKTKIRQIKEDVDNVCEEFGRNSNEQVHGNLMIHQVCRNKKRLLQKVYVEAHVTADDLDTGSSVKTSERAKIRPHFRTCNTDHAGHVIGNEIGGLGYEWNMFPQSASLNVGHWKTVSNRAVRHLREQHKQEIENYTNFKMGRNPKIKEVLNRHVTIEMAFMFEDVVLYNRPNKLYYKFCLYIENKCDVAIYGRFLNEDYTDSELASCPGDDNDLQYFVYFPDKRSESKFTARQTCDVENQYKYLFSPP